MIGKTAMKKVEYLSVSDTTEPELFRGSALPTFITTSAGDGSCFFLPSMLSTIAPSPRPARFGAFERTESADLFLANEMWRAKDFGRNSRFSASSFANDEWSDIEGSELRL